MGRRGRQCRRHVSLLSKAFRLRHARRKYVLCFAAAAIRRFSLLHRRRSVLRHGLRPFSMARHRNAGSEFRRTCLCGCCQPSRLLRCMRAVGGSRPAAACVDRADLARLASGDECAGQSFQRRTLSGDRSVFASGMAPEALLTTERFSSGSRAAKVTLWCAFRSEGKHSRVHVWIRKTRRHRVATSGRSSPDCTRNHPSDEAVHFAAIGHRLAALAPERHARIRTLEPPANGFVAAAAGLPIAAVDPDARADRWSAWCGDASHVGHHRIARVLKHIAAFTCRKRRGEGRRNLDHRQVANVAERVDAVTKQISDLNSLPTPAITSWCSNTSPISSPPSASMRRFNFSSVKLLAQHIDLRRRNPQRSRSSERPQHLCDRNAESDGLT